MADGHDPAAVERELARELLRLHCDAYGVAVRHGSSHVHVLDDVVVFVMDDLQMLPDEQFLIDAGKGDAVVEVRSRFQQAIEVTFTAAVERATGRHVTSFASVTRLSPDYAVEIFRLAPTDNSHPLGP